MAISIIHLASVESTNAYARELAGQGAAHGTLVLSDRQTSGRGRLGRVWEDGGFGNCMASLILRPDFEVKKAPLICLAAAVAIQEVSGPLIGVKWPNDLLASDGKKVGGILAEMELRNGQLDFVILGFGVNLKHAPADVVQAGCLAEYGLDWEPMPFAQQCAEKLLLWVKWLAADTSTLIAAWNRVDMTSGRPVTVGDISGRAMGIQDDGALMVDTSDGRRHTVRAGDVCMVAEL